MLPSNKNNRMYMADEWKTRVNPFGHSVPYEGHRVGQLKNV